MKRDLPVLTHQKLHNQTGESNYNNTPTLKNLVQCFRERLCRNNNNKSGEIPAKGISIAEKSRGNINWGPCINGQGGSYANFTVLEPVSYEHLKESTPRQSISYFDEYAVSQGNDAFENGYFELAKYYYKVAANHGSLTALHNLGVMFLHGQGISKDTKRAYKCFMLCASYGVAGSMSQLGYMYFYGRGVIKDYSKARSWFTRSVEINQNAYSLYHLGIIFLLALGILKDEEKGKRYLLACIAEDFCPAIYNVAVCYTEGKHGFPINLAAAIYLYNRLREQTPSAQNNIGVLIANEDPVAAFDLFRIAALNGGISEAAYNLGHAYSDGIGVSQDLRLASKYFKTATLLRPNSHAEYELGLIYLHGDGKTIKQDRKKSIYWFEKSAGHGNRAASKRLLFITKQFKQDKFRN